MVRVMIIVMRGKMTSVPPRVQTCVLRCVYSIVYCATKVLFFVVRMEHQTDCHLYWTQMPLHCFAILVFRVYG